MRPVNLLQSQWLCVTKGVVEWVVVGLDQLAVDETIWLCCM